MRKNIKRLNSSNRQRKIIWFSPPNSQNVKINIKIIAGLIESLNLAWKHFP